MTVLLPLILAAAPFEQPPAKLPAGIDPALADWTPRPAQGKVEPWEKMLDKDWVDARFREMNTGPALNCTLRYPVGKGTEVAYKAIVIKLDEKGDVCAAYDRSTMQLVAIWTGGHLNHSDRRFGLLNTPTPKGTMLFSAAPRIAWSVEGAPAASKPPFTAPPDPEVKYRGHFVANQRVTFLSTVGDREVNETVALDAKAKGGPAILRTVRVGPGKKAISWAADGATDKPTRFAPSDEAQYAGRKYGGETDFEDRYLKARAIGKARWGEPLVTKLERGNTGGPFGVDTLTVPYKNRLGALFFCTGLDFLPDGRVAVCTCHGDVWLVTVGEAAKTCSWQRHATGLYHALGLKVIDDKVIVLERGQLTRLHDLNNDGEADFYECVNNAWHCGGGEHSYDTCLETDPQGNFYFFKTGDTHTAHGGCLMRVSKDGAKAEVFATGFRHPIGLGMSSSGVITGADQEGNWMPATRIDQYKQGGFYGDMRAHHRATPPKTYDAPLCWLPREVDNSAGGQVWVPEKAWGALGGKPLHFSYGRCRPYVLLRQDLSDGRVQGGVAGLPIEFLSGVCRGRFLGDTLYVCGLNGWQTAAKADGCLQRVRPTGKPLDAVVGFETEGNTIRLTFARDMDADAAKGAANYKAAWWNYRWSGEYGSKRWKVSDPSKEGMDEVPVRSSKLLEDKRTLELTFEALKPVMQMQVGFNVKAADGKPVVGSVLLTLHEAGK
jgi:hypothetical protein